MSIFQSRKFWAAILDVAVTLILFFTAKYMPANTAEDVKVVIIAIQPIVVMYIAGVTIEDTAKLKAGVHPTQKQP